MRKVGVVATAAFLMGVAHTAGAEEVGAVADKASAIAPQIRSGLREITGAATLIVPNSSAKDALGVVSGRFGYYVSGRSIVGVGTTFFVYSRVTDLYATAHYRFLLRAGGARFQPYLGASAGTNLLSYWNWGGAQTRFLASGDAGFRYFFSRRTGLETALSLNYIHGSGDGFSRTTSTVLTFGLAHVF